MSRKQKCKALGPLSLLQERIWLKVHILYYENLLDSLGLSGVALTGDGLSSVTSLISARRTSASMSRAVLSKSDFFRLMMSYDIEISIKYWIKVHNLFIRNKQWHCLIFFKRL